MVAPIVNPEIPYNGDIPGGLEPGRMCRLQGVTHPNADRFNINFQTGPNEKPRDDVAVHLSVRLNQGYIARNSYKDENWGDEQGSGTLPIGPAQSWEIIILVDKNDYKIAVNGQHFCDFPHRIPISEVTHLLIDGDVSITLISWEGISGVGNTESSSRASQVNAEGPQGAPQGYGGPQGGYAPQGGYGPPPGSYGSYGVPPTGYGGYAPPPPPGAQPEESGLDNFWNQAQGVLAGAIRSGAAEKLLGGLLSGGGQQNQSQGYAHQNAKYGIYPDLPPDLDVNLKQAQMKQQPGPVENILTGLLSGGNKQQTGAPPYGSQQTQSGVDINSLLSGLLGGNQQNPQGTTAYQQQHNTQQNVSGSQQGQGTDLGSLLSGLLSGGNTQHPSGQAEPGQAKGPPGTQQPGQPGSQSQGIDLTQVLAALSGLMSNTRPIQETGGQHPGPLPPTSNTANRQQEQGGLDFNSLLSNLLSGGNQPQHPGQIPPGPQRPGQAPGNYQQGQGVDLNALLSGLLSGNQQQGPAPPGTYPPGQPGYQNPNVRGSQQSQGDDLGSLLSGLLSGGGTQNPQRPYTPGGPPPPYQGSNPQQPPQSGPQNIPPSGPQNIPPSNTGGGNPAASGPGNTKPKSSQPASEQEFDDVSDKLADVIASEGNTGRDHPAQTPGQQQYGQYPHPPTQQQQGPIESLLSNFLGGGGGQQPVRQQPQFGGGESIGGLGSMSGFLSGLLQPRDGNQRQNY